MQPARIIGFAGQAGVGKSVAAAAVSRRWGHEVNSFGSNIKDVGESLYGINVPFLRLVRGQLKRGEPVAVDALARCVAIRQQFWQMSQHLDKHQPGCWTRAAMRFADMSLPDGRGLRDRDAVKCPDGLFRPRVVFDDVRKPEELEAIKERGGYVVYLLGPSLWGQAPGFDTRVVGKMCDWTMDVEQASQVVAFARANAQDWEEAERAMGDEIVRALVRVNGWSLGDADLARPSDHHVREDTNPADSGALAEDGPLEPEDVPDHGLPLE